MFDKPFQLKLDYSEGAIREFSDIIPSMERRKINGGEPRPIYYAIPLREVERAIWSGLNKYDRATREESYRTFSEAAKLGMMKLGIAMVETWMGVVEKKGLPIREDLANRANELLGHLRASSETLQQ